MPSAWSRNALFNWAKEPIMAIVENRLNQPNRPIKWAFHKKAVDELKSAGAVAWVFTLYDVNHVFADVFAVIGNPLDRFG
jgi:hypothetical protein